MKWLRKLLEQLWHWLDRQLHEVTYQELDELCCSLSNKVDKLEEEKEYLEDALIMPKTKKFRNDDY